MIAVTFFYCQGELSFSKVFYRLNFDLHRYDYMAAFEGIRALEKLVNKEGEVVVNEADGLEPRQDNVTVPPMQLSGPSIWVTDSYNNHENTGCPQASLHFQEFQELIKTPPDDSPTDVYDFNFLLSDVNKDNHEDDPQKTVSSYSPSQFDCLSLMQGNMMCKATDSYQMTQVGRIQAGEGSSNKWKTIRKPSLEKRMPVRRAPQVNPDPVPERKRTAPINPAYTIRKSRVTSSVHLRPYRDRVIHLLALKDYKKPELLIRLQKDGITKNDKNSLGEILHQVANLNTQNSSYSLKDYVFKELQKDWPGYNEVERQSLELVLSTKVDALQNAMDTNSTESSVGCGRDRTSREQLSNAAINLSRRKVRISRLTTGIQSTPNSCVMNISANSALGLSGRSEVTASSIRLALPTTHPPSLQPPQPARSSSNSWGNAERPGTLGPRVASFSENTKISGSPGAKHPPLKTVPSVSIQTTYPEPMETNPLTSNKKSEYTFTEREAKDQEYDIDMTGRQETDRERQGEGAKPDFKEVKEECTASGNTSAASGLPGSLANYVPIVSSEQRQQYEQEFREEYDEYQGLYAKMLTLSRVFVNLDSERKNLSPDSKEYQDINKKISLEYQKMKQINPNYYAEKHRCQYLYNKLVHIKKLINDYDQQHVKSQQWNRAGSE
ncbi:RNA polymerase II elongation factor ELL2-like [Meles meles]|uniref:RNA polymerase II elongation factor ELL2-like n=1 Tax=Meles meles TaxID=9662 RepID=UPI001E698A2F|nr:RNA polymerase II elongation factor ELL2-like [Meles meles]